MSSQDYLATAFVQIRPKITGFQKELRTQVETAVAGIKSPSINVSPTTKNFQSLLRTQIRDAVSTLGPQPIPVTPVLTAFRQRLAKELAENPIPVVVQPIEKAARKSVSQSVAKDKEKETTATRKLTAAEEAELAIEKQLSAEKESRNAITAKLREVESLYTQARAEGISVEEKAALITTANVKAREALNEVTERQVALERSLVTASLEARAAATVKKVENFGAQVRDQLAVADAAARQAAELTSLEGVQNKLFISQDRFNQAQSGSLKIVEKVSLLDKELSTVKALEEKISEELVVSLARENETRTRILTGLKAETAELRANITAKLSKAQVDLQANTVANLQKDISAGIVALNAVEVKSITDLKIVKEQLTAVTELQALAEEQLQIAQRLGLTTVEQTTIANQQLLASRRTQLEDQKKAIKGTEEFTGKLGQARRGILATSLSFLGIRGATLAAGSSFLIGAAAVASFAKAIGSAASFEQELNVFQATAAATAQEMKEVQRVAVDLGADITLPGVGAADAAEAMTALAKAGIEVQDALDGARGVLQLATAAQISNAEATELVASALNAFGLAGIEATRVADLLAGASIEAQGSIQDMGIALQQSSAVARQANLNLDDTVAFITLLAQAGIRGSDAGTSIRTAILRLIAPTKEATKELRKLGLTVFDAQQNFRPEIFAEIDRALSGLNETAKNQVLRRIFGQDAIRFAVIAGRAGTEGLNNVRDAVSETGLAAQLAEARTKGFSGQVSALKNSFEQLGLAIGKSIIPTLEPVLAGLTVSVGGLGAAFNAVGPEILAFAAAFAVANTRAFGLISVFGKLIESMTAMTSSTTTLKASLLSFAKGPNAIALGVGALAAGLVYLATRESEADRITRQLAEGTERLAGAMREAADATTALRDKQQSLPGITKAVVKAEKDVATARDALQQSDAAEGTARRETLTNNLTLALRAQEKAITALGAAEAGIRLLQEDQQAAIERRKIAITEEISLIGDLITERQRAAAVASQAEFGRGNPNADVQALQLDFISEALRKQVTEGQISADRFVRDMARRKEAVLTVIEVLNRVPTEKEFQLIFNASDVSATTKKILGLFEHDANIGLVGQEIADRIVTTAKDRLIARAQELVDALAGALKKSEVKQSLFEEQIDIVTITGGSTEAQLAIVRKQIAERQADVDRIVAAEAAKRRAGETTGLDTLRKQRQQARSDLAGLVSQEEQLEEEIKNDAEQAKKDIEEKRKERAQAILKIFSSKEQKALNKVAIAEQTKTLKDDIATNTALLAVYEQQKIVARKKIKDAEVLADFLAEVDQKIFEIGLEVAADRKELRQQIRQEQRDARERVITGLNLDIELAEINENKKKEISLRRQLIRALEDQIKHEKGNTNKIKELRNEIARQRQAIREATNEEKKRQSDSRELFFQFLQTQQGFAANLLGNLIPGFATAGLVGSPGGTLPPPGGGTSPDIGEQFTGPFPILPQEHGRGGGPSAGLPAAAAVSGAKDRVVRPFQVDRTNHILMQILRVLQGRPTNSPEIAYNKSSGGAMMDFV